MGVLEVLEEVVHVWEAQPAAREICALRRVQMQERSGGSVDVDDTVAGGMEERGEGTHEFAFEGVKGARGALDGGEVCGMEGVEGQVPEGRGPVDEPVCIHARTHARTVERCSVSGMERQWGRPVHALHGILQPVELCDGQRVERRERHCAVWWEGGGGGGGKGEEGGRGVY